MADLPAAVATELLAAVVTPTESEASPACAGCAGPGLPLAVTASGRGPAEYK